jgi:hypothetical protein
MDRMARNTPMYIDMPVPERNTGSPVPERSGETEIGLQWTARYTAEIGYNTDGRAWLYVLYPLRSVSAAMERV